MSKPSETRRLRAVTAGCAAAVVLGLAPLRATAAPDPSRPTAQAMPVASVPATALPPAVMAALARARIGPETLHVWIGDVEQPRPRLGHQTDVPANPASLMKLATTAAALEQLGPGFTWSTGVFVDGPVRDGRLEGNLLIQGRGDPKLVHERLWQLLSRVRQSGIREIRGDIVLDRGAFVLPPHDPAAFDGEPRRPYNVGPDALMLQLRSQVLTFTPDAAAGVARVTVEPVLAGVRLEGPRPSPERPAREDGLSLRLTGGPCGDWRGTLGLDLSDPSRVRLQGDYPASCGERRWPLAYVDPASYDARLLGAMWASLDGRLRGKVRDGRVGTGATPFFELASPPLADVIRDVNRFSNNVMAQQVFLSLSLQAQGSGTPAGSRELVRRWLVERAGCDAAAVVVDNGSGLSRENRLSAACLAALLRQAWRSPWMPELLASLPVAGEGTARRATGAAGRAHLKTGSLNNVAGLAGVVHAADGRRQVFVALINHPAAAGDDARQVLDALLRWTLEEPSR